jgi:aldose 1-epimerase
MKYIELILMSSLSGQYDDSSDQNIFNEEGRMNKLIKGRIALLFLIISTLILIQTYSCQKTGDPKMEIKKEIYGTLQDGREVYQFTLETTDGSELKLMNYGATVLSLKVSDRDGKMENVILGFKDFKDYENIRHFYGAIVGRWGNRIDKGKFSLNGKEYTLATNNGENHLHGGIMGFDRVLWDCEELTHNDLPAVKFSYLSKDGEEGYPGNLKLSVIYTYSEEHELGIYYEMSTDQPTVKNVTNHSYFNLSGNVKSDILNHELVLHADYFLPVVPGLIPTGELRPVKGTPMDFTSPHKIGERINADDEQLNHGLGYDHCWVINKSENGMNNAGYIYDNDSGRRMDIFTTEPAIQFYSGNFMDGSDIGNEGLPYKYRYALCLETQHYPDSPNQDEFPTTVLNPGEVYKSTTIYKFSVK